MKRYVVLTAVVFMVSISQAGVYDDATGHWQFEGSDPQLVVDSTPNGNNLYFGNSTGIDGEDGVRVNNGLLGKAMYCPWAAGMASSVTDNDALDFQPYEPFSIAIWVKNENRDRNSIIVSKQNSTGNYRGYSVAWQSNDTLQFLLRSENVEGKRLWVRMNVPVGEIVAADDQWVHVAVTYNGIMSKSGVKLYLNGFQLDPSLYSDFDSNPGISPSDDTSNSIPFVLGGRNTSSAFGGYLDEAAIWKRVLSGSEVKEAMALTLPAIVSQTQTPLLVAENLPGSFDLELTSQPSSNVVIYAIPSSSDIDLGQGPGSALSLYFTPANWNQAQTVAITGEEQELPYTAIIEFNIVSADTNIDDRYLPPVMVVVKNGAYRDPFLQIDFNKDHHVDLADFAVMAMDWLKCTMPGYPECTYVTYSGLTGDFIETLTPGKRDITIPTIDISGETERHVVIAQGTPEYSQNHCNTEMMTDGTIFIIWSDGHGGPIRYLKKSTDGGLSWSDLLDIPDNWPDYSNCPAFYRLADPQGIERVFVFASVGPEGGGMYQARTEDEGNTWSLFEPTSRNDDIGLLFANGMPFTTIEPVEDGNELIGLTNIRRPGEGYPTTVVVQSRSVDGGLTWSDWDIILDLGNPYRPCEPDIIRSPDGQQLLMIMRENEQSFNSWIMLSDNEGRTWSNPFQAPASVSMDRHQHKYTPDGRLIILGRDTADESPTESHFVAWVGTYEDLVNGNEGQYRVKLLHHYGAGSAEYPSIELLSDGTFLAFNAVGYYPEDLTTKSIVSTRFTMDELDQKYNALNN